MVGTPQDRIPTQHLPWKSPPDFILSVSSPLLKVIKLSCMLYHMVSTTHKLYCYAILQNRYMMGFGAFTFVLCISYIIAWSMMSSEQRKTTYTAMDDQDNLVSRKKKSRWE